MVYNTVLWILGLKANADTVSIFWLLKYEGNGDKLQIQMWEREMQLIPRNFKELFGPTQIFLGPIKEMDGCYPNHSSES